MKKSISIFVYEFVGVFSFRFVRGGEGKKNNKNKSELFKMVAANKIVDKDKLKWKNSLPKREYFHLEFSIKQ